MRDDAFRSYLVPALTTAGVSSYLSNARRVERVLRIDLDTADLDDTDVAALGQRLLDSGIGRSTVSNCLSAIRSYAAFRSGCPPRDKPIRRSNTPTRSMVHRRTVVTPTNGLALHSVSELMRMYAAILGELRRRNVLRTGNGPVGDYAEMLFAEAFAWTLSTNSTAGYDAVDCHGKRYQIKARPLQTGSASRQLSAIRKLPERPFDYLAAALFDCEMAILRAAIIPFETVSTLARWGEHTNSWRVMMSDTVWSAPGVRDVTDELRATANLPPTNS